MNVLTCEDNFSLQINLKVTDAEDIKSFFYARENIFAERDRKKEW